MDNTSGSIKEYYDEVYKKQVFSVDPLISGFFCSEISDALIGDLKKKNGKNILDMGCSDASLLRLMKSISDNNRYYGADVSDDIIGKNRTRVSGIDFFPCDSLRTDFENDFFDIITSTMVIEHVDDDKAMIDEIRRITNQGGRVYITTVLKGKHAFYYLKNDKNETVLELSHRREYRSKEEFLSLFEESFDLMDCRVKRICFPVFDFFARRIGSLNKMNKNLIGILRMIKVPIAGYYSIECIFVKK